MSELIAGPALEEEAKRLEELSIALIQEKKLASP
jgi:hypothetical protein